MSDEKTRAQQIMAGLMFLNMQFGRTVSTAAEHDVFYAGAPGDDTPNCVEAMTERGWHRDEFNEGWAIFT